MLDRYRQMDLSTASPVTLVVRLYEGAIRNASQARLHLEAGRIAERGRSLSKALAIVSELQATLDFEQGGEVARNLDDLYGYVCAQLLEGNLSESAEAIDRAVSVLATLNEGWTAISRCPVDPSEGA